MKTLVIGAGADITLLSRGEKAERIKSQGLRMRDGITGEAKTVKLAVATAPVKETYDLVMVLVQAV